MAIKLPTPVARYFEADKNGGPEATAQCFIDSATVRDEGKTYVGRDSIRRWKEEAAAKFSYTADPFSIIEESGRLLVTAHLSGKFPGSPIDLRYIFKLEGEKIAELEIIP